MIPITDWEASEWIAAAYVVFAILVSIIVGVVLFRGSRHGPGKCAKGHYEKVHHPEWIQFIPSGKTKTIIPIVHEAYDSNDWHCDQHEVAQ